MMIVKSSLITEPYSHIALSQSNLNGKSAVETIEYTHAYYVLNHTFMITSIKKWYNLVEIVVIFWFVL